MVIGRNQLSGDQRRPGRFDLGLDLVDVSDQRADMGDECDVVPLALHRHAGALP